LLTNFASTETEARRARNVDSVPEEEFFRRRLRHPRRVLQAVDHVVVAVRDLAAAGASWSRLFARSPSWTGEHPGNGTANLLFRLDNTYVELLAAAGPGALGEMIKRRLDSEGEGLFALAFATRDAEAFRAVAAERGLEPGPVTKGLGRDVQSGAFREWCTVPLAPARTRGLHLFAIEHRSPPDLLPAMPTLRPAEAAPHALDHVVVRTTSPDASRALFGDALGMRLALDRRFDAFGFRGLFFRLGGATLEVAGPLDDAADTGADTLSGLAWQVRDVSAAQARLAAAGFDVSAVRTGRKPGTAVCTVRDGTSGVPTLLVGPAGAA
jgi:catechol 2,3-dioxygenase-like lactoylglutathione lyase family enzyme